MFQKKKKMNEKDNIIKSKRKYKQFKTQQHQAAEPQTKVQPTEPRWLKPYTTKVKLQPEPSLPTRLLNFNLSQSLQIKTKIS